MKKDLKDLICTLTGASAITGSERIQELWSGYGEILRIHLNDAETPSIIAKLIQIPERRNHPRGWNSDLSHERKVRSYQVEASWYQYWSAHCGAESRIPKFLCHEQIKGGSLLLLEDLDGAGYPLRLSSVTPSQLRACLDWLAHFHATFMGVSPHHLWEKGSYWQLDTRREELEALSDLPLKEAAPLLDQRLSSAHFQSLIHGDAKLANFCFAPAGEAVAAVDFQYVGGGCGMKDLAYFIGSCLDEEECAAQESELLTHYFETLQRALHKRKSDLDPLEVEREWRALYPIAWADFHRFLKGWSPGHWKIHSYSERICAQVLKTL